MCLSSDVLLGDCTNGEGRRTLVMVNLGLPGDLDKTNEVHPLSLYYMYSR